MFEKRLFCLLETSMVHLYYSDDGPVNGFLYCLYGKFTRIFVCVPDLL